MLRVPNAAGALHTVTVSRAVRPLGWLLACLLAPTVIAIHARGSLPSGLTYASSAGDVLRTYALGDPASYIRYGRYLLSGDPEALPLTGCWPPGMGAINAAIFALSGESAFVLKTMALSVVLWGIALYAVLTTLRVPAHPLAKFAVVNAIWVFPSFRYGLLVTASIFSESRAIPLFILAVALFVRGLETRVLGYHVGGAVTFAAAAYLRPVYEPVAIVGGGMAFAVALVHRARVPRGAAREPGATRSARDVLVAAAVLAVIVAVAMLPWKGRNLALFGKFSLAVCADRLYVDMWSHEPPTFLLSIDSACVAAPARCAAVGPRLQTLTPEEGRRMLLATILESPVAYFANKLRYVPDFWVGTPWEQLGVKNRAFLVEGLLSLAAGLLTVAWAAKSVVRERGERSAFGAFVLGFCLTNLAIFTVAHFEYRFSAPIRLLFLFSPWWLASLSPRPSPS